jgi:excisionase family DNA binding protein
VTTDPRPHWARNLSEADWALAERNLFTAVAAAAYMGTSRAWVFRAAREHRIPLRKIGRRHLLRKQDLEQLLGGP